MMNMNNMNNPMMNMNMVNMNNINNPMMNMNMMNMNNPMMNMNNPMMNINMMNMNNPMMNMNMMNMNNPMMNMNMMNLYQNNLSNSGKLSNNMDNAPKKQNSKLGRLPRDKSTSYYTIPDNNNNYFNIIFTTPSGNKTNINAPVNFTLYNLLCKYMEKIGLGPNLICNGIYFLYDGRKLKKEDYNKPISTFFNNTNAATVIVLDAGNLIGAYFFDKIL